MEYSDFRKGFEQHRIVKSGSATSGTSVAKLQLPLNRDNVTASHILHLAASQAFSADPTGSDVRRAIESITLELTGGVKPGMRFSVDGFQLYDMARFTESQPSPVVSLPSGGTGGTATAAWSVDIHHILDAARNDMQTAINTGLYSGVDLTINFATTANQLFTGGTASGAVSLTVDVEARDYPVIPQQPNLSLIASAAKIEESFSRSMTGAGDVDVDIRSGSNKTRALMIHARDGSGVLSDAILGDIVVKVGNWIYKTTFTRAQQDNVHKRGFDVAGCAVLDFGDDPMGFLPLEGVKDATVTCSALAAGSFKVLQVRMEDL